MEAILAQVHYLPMQWKGKAHTCEVKLCFCESNGKGFYHYLYYFYQVRLGLAKLFQFKAVYLLEELISPLVTPFILYFALRPKALEIVDFLRQFTVEVVGVGDVCSFAQLDLQKHGQPQWQSVINSQTEENSSLSQEEELYNDEHHVNKVRIRSLYLTMYILTKRIIAGYGRWKNRAVFRY